MFSQCDQYKYRMSCHWYLRFFTWYLLLIVDRVVESVRRNEYRNLLIITLIFWLQRFRYRYDEMKIRLPLKVIPVPVYRIPAYMQQRGTSTFGSDVHAGEPSVELDAMKMIITARASESWRSHMRIWYLLASLELRDPSKVKNDRNFWRWAWRLKHTFETQSNQSLVDSKETQLEDPNAVTGATDQFCLIDENVVSEMFFFTRWEHPHHYRPNVLMLVVPDQHTRMICVCVREDGGWFRWRMWCLYSWFTTRECRNPSQFVRIEGTLGWFCQSTQMLVTTLSVRIRSAWSLGWFRWQYLRGVLELTALTCRIGPFCNLKSQLLLVHQDIMVPVTRSGVADATNRYSETPQISHLLSQQLDEYPIKVSQLEESVTISKESINQVRAWFRRISFLLLGLLILRFCISFNAVGIWFSSEI